MDEKVKLKIAKFTERAISINEKLLANEKKFLADVANSSKHELQAKSDALRDLVRKERLFLEAVQFYLKR